jgi:hypothetical protein
MDIFNIKKVKDLEARLCKSIEILEREHKILEDYHTIAKAYQLKLEISEREVSRLRAENEALKAKLNN